MSFNVCWVSKFLKMQLKINVNITEEHFRGTFEFPHDLDFLGKQTEHECFVNLFNRLIDERIDYETYKLTDEEF